MMRMFAFDRNVFVLLIDTAVAIEFITEGMSRGSLVIWSHHYKNGILVSSNWSLSFSAIADSGVSSFEKFHSRR